MKDALRITRNPPGAFVTLKAVLVCGPVPIAKNALIPGQYP